MNTEAVVEPAIGEETRPSFSPRSLLAGASALIVATGIERACGFLANLIAARLGGAATFGGYSLAMTTANNIAAYAGAGIGSTANRFAGEYPDGSPAAATVGRALALMSVVSAALATALLLAGSGPLARVLLGQPALAPLLQWASLSAGVMILFECCRGFLIGRRRLRGLLTLSGITGAGMITVLPFASHAGPIAMVSAQAVVAMVAILAVLATFLEWRPRRRDVQRDAGTPDGGDLMRMAGRVWSFGFVQLLGIVGLNAAGWWIASIVSRSDASLVEMGIFAVANQVRNVVALVPGLLTQSSYALMANEDAAPSRVLLFCTFLASFVVLVLGGFGILFCPLLLPLVWGHAYSGGVLAGSLAFATAIVHMSGAASAARLTILSLPITGIINAIWSALVAGLSILFFAGFRPGNAAAIATAIYLVSHLLSAVLVLLSLLRLGQAPPGLIPLFLLANGAATLLAGLAGVHALHTFSPLAIGAAQFGVVVLGAAGILGLGKRHGFSPESLLRPVAQLARRFRGAVPV